MAIIMLFSWWYTTGWLKAMHTVGQRLQSVLGFFSVGMLVKSLFSPFRQISAGGVQGPIGVQFRAWGDRQFSRVIGAVIRLILIIIGGLMALAVALGGLLFLLIWPLLPLLPIFGLLLSFSGLGL